MAPPNAWTVTLRDGQTVILRPLTLADKLLIEESFDRLSEQSRYRRFFLRMQALPPTLLDALVDVDHHDREAIIALSMVRGEALGVARYTRVEDDPEIAEIAVTVVDDWQNRGLGTALLRRLTNQARRQGIRRFSARVLAENPEALLLFSTLGGSSQHFSGGVMEVIVDLPPRRASVYDAPRRFGRRRAKPSFRQGTSPTSCSASGVTPSEPPSRRRHQIDSAVGPNLASKLRRIRSRDNARPLVETSHAAASRRSAG